MAKLGVNVVLEKAATVEAVRESSFDKVILACGAEPSSRLLREQKEGTLKRPARY